MKNNKYFSIPLKNVVFDMDGLLLDTEPLWGVSMTKVAESHGIPIQPFQFKYTTGLKINEVTQYWKQNLFSDHDFNALNLADEIVEDIIARSKTDAVVLPGVIDHIEYLKRQGVRLAVATSSPQKMMDGLLEHFNLKKYFDHCQSAESCLFGKPHPEVYLKALEAIDGLPAQSCAVEDSVNGMIAAKAAQMRVVIVPEHEKINDRRFGLADRTYFSMSDMPFEEWETICQ